MMPCIMCVHGLFFIQTAFTTAYKKRHDKTCSICYKLNPIYSHDTASQHMHTKKTQKGILHTTGRLPLHGLFQKRTTIQQPYKQHVSVPNTRFFRALCALRIVLHVFLRSPLAPVTSPRRRRSRGSAGDGRTSVDGVPTKTTRTRLKYHVDS